MSKPVADTDSLVLALLGVFSAFGAFAFYVFYGATFTQFYLMLLVVGVLFMGFNPSSLVISRQELPVTIGIGLGGFAFSLLFIQSYARWLVSFSPVQAAALYPFAATSLEVFWIGLSSNVPVVQSWWATVTGLSMLFPAVCENVLFFGGGLTWLADAAEHTEGYLDNHIANVFFSAVVGMVFGMFHILKIYGQENYWLNFLANPYPIGALMILGVIWGLMTLYLGFVPAIIAHWLWNMFSVLLGVVNIGMIAAGAIVIYSLKFKVERRTSRNGKA